MSVEDEAKTEEAEIIVRYLGENGNIGKRKTPHNISKGVSKNKTKIYQQKVEKILLLLVSWTKEIFGYQKIEDSRLSLFWVKTEIQSYKVCFRNFLGSTPAKRLFLFNSIS